MLRSRPGLGVCLAATITLLLPGTVYALWEECLPAWTEVRQGSYDGPLLRIEDFHMNCLTYDSLGGSGVLRIGAPIENPAVPPLPPRYGAKQDPVTGDGEFAETDTDIEFPGEGLNYRFTRTYRSRAPFVGDLGYSWDHNYDQRLTTSCDGSVAYQTGQMGTVVFKPDPTHPGSYLPDYRYKLLLQPANDGQGYGFTITDWSSGNVSTFRSTGGNSVSGALLLSSIRSPFGFAINVFWDSWKSITGTQFHVKSVQDTTGRIINYVYYSTSSPSPKAPLLQCLSFKPDCSAPLVSFQYDTTEDELTSVLKGTAATGVHYQYHHGETDVSWIPSTVVQQTCTSMCSPRSYDCNNEDLCGRINRMCQVSNETSCVRYFEAQCIQKCSDADSACLQSCENEDANQYSQYCYPTSVWSGYQEKWLNSYLAPDKYPFCTQAIFAASPANCVADCANFYRNTAYTYTFGQPTDLNHNIIEIDDASGRVILKNTYGSNPGDVSFDRVVAQQLLDSDVGHFDYHDLSLEWLYGANSNPPSRPDPTHVVPLTQFQSKNVCPSTACTDVGCPAPVNDSNAEVPQQRAAFATVFTDIHGVATTDYYDADWDLLREVNWGNSITAPETTDYNYGASGGLVSDGQIAAVQNPAGDRICYSRNDAGAPTTILHIPSPTYGNADWREEAFSYVGGSTSTFISQYVADTRAPRTVTYNGLGGDVRPDSIVTQVSDNTFVTTTFGYEYHFAPVTKTDPNGSVTAYDNFDYQAAQPQSITIDAKGASPLQRYASFDPVFSLPQEVGVTGGAGTHFTYDDAGRVLAIQKRTTPTDGWFTTTMQYDGGDDLPSKISDPHHIQDPVYDGNNNVVNLMDWPTTSTEVGRRTCSHYAGDGRLLETISPEGDSIIYSYDAEGRPTSIVKGFNPTPAAGSWATGCGVDEHTPPVGDPGLQTVASWSYYPGGFPKSFTKDAITYDVQVDGFGRVLELSNGAGVKHRKGYDRLGRVTWEAVYQDAYDPTCKRRNPPNCPEPIPGYHYPAFGDAGLVSMTEFAYDGLSRVVRTIRWHLEDQTKQVISTTYDDASSTITTTDSFSQQTESTKLDGVGRVVRHVRADGSTETVTYSDNGFHADTTVQTNFGAVKVSRDFDGLQLLSQKSINGQLVFSEIHDVDGKPLSRYEESKGTKVFHYDSFRRSTLVTRESYAPVVYGWDGDDRLKSTTVCLDAACKQAEVSLRTYDGLGRLITEVDPLGKATNYVYVSGSPLVSSRTSSSGITKTFTYDPAGRLAQATTALPGQSTPETMQFTHTALDLISTAAITGAPFGGDNVTTLSYDSFGRPISESNSLTGAFVKHEYRPRSATGTDDQVLTWVNSTESTPTLVHHHDILGRLRSVDVAGNPVATYDYGPAGVGGPRSLAWTNSGGPTVADAFSYDSRGRQVGVDVLADTTAVASRRDILGTDGIARQRQYAFTGTPTVSDFFQVDAAGAVTAEALAVPGVPLLSGAVTNDSVEPYIRQGDWRAYQVDSAANILSVQTSRGAVTRNYDALNRFTKDSTSAAARYDADDNLSALSTSGFIPKTYFAITYDGAKHPVSIKVGSAETHLSYDALGRRIAESTAAGVSYFVWDGARIVAHGAASSAMTLDVPGEGIDDHLAEVGQLGHGKRTWLHQAHDKSVLAETDEHGQLNGGYSYSAFGERRTIGQQPSDNRFLYQGQLFDPWANSYSMRAREYFPGFQRFASADPLGLAPGPNAYAFGNGDPLAFRDPLGLSPRRNPYGSQLLDQEELRLGVLRQLWPFKAQGAEFLSNAANSTSALGSLGWYTAWAANFAPELVETLVHSVYYGSQALDAGDYFNGTLLVGGGVGGLAAPFAGGAAGLAENSSSVGAAVAEAVGGGVDTAELSAIAQDGADQVHAELDPFAQNRRTTVVAAGTDADGSTAAYVMTGGARSLTAAQDGTANSLGLSPLNNPGLDHGEGPALESVLSEQFQQAVIAASRPFCGVCTDRLIDAGFKLTGPRTAVKGF